MPELIAKSPLSGVWPLAIDGLRLSERLLGQVTSVAPLPGQETAVANALKPLGLGFPAPNRVLSNGEVTLLWAGKGQAFLIGAPAPAGLPGAALTDQSDGWACLQLEGRLAAEALMRLYPLDLRPQSFAVGAVARAPLNHMQSILMRPAADTFDILVFRSMARTAWHEIAAAMKTLAARAALG